MNFSVFAFDAGTGHGGAHGAEVGRCCVPVGGPAVRQGYRPGPALGSSGLQIGVYWCAATLGCPTKASIAWKRAP